MRGPPWSGVQAPCVAASIHAQSPVPVGIDCAAGTIGMVQLEGTPLDEDDLESIAEALDIFPPTSAGYSSKASSSAHLRLLSNCVLPLSRGWSLLGMILGMKPWRGMLLFGLRPSREMLSHWARAFKRDAEITVDLPGFKRQQLIGQLSGVPYVAMCVSSKC
jgi:hypothetical protein